MSRLLLPVIAIGVLFSSPLEAKPKKRKKSNSQASPVSDTQAAPAVQYVPVAVPVQTAAPAQAPAPTRTVREEVIVEKKTESGYYLALGLGQAINSKIKYSKKITVGSTGATIDQKTTNILERGNVFTLEISHFNPGKMGFMLGAYYEPSRRITSVEFDFAGDTRSIETEGLTYSQYGGHLNVLMSGEMPYGYIGVNYGVAELKEGEDDEEPTKFNGELGGQIGLGLRFGDYFAFEGSYRITQFSKEDDGLLGKERSTVSMESMVASFKLLLH